MGQGLKPRSEQPLNKIKCYFWAYFFFPLYAALFLQSLNSHICLIRFAQYWLSGRASIYPFMDFKHSCEACCVLVSYRAKIKKDSTLRRLMVQSSWVWNGWSSDLIRGPPLEPATQGSEIEGAGMLVRKSTSAYCMSLHSGNLKTNGRSSYKTCLDTTELIGLKKGVRVDTDPSYSKAFRQLLW